MNPRRTLARFETCCGVLPLTDATARFAPLTAFPVAWVTCWARLRVCATIVFLHRTGAHVS